MPQLIPVRVLPGAYKWIPVTHRLARQESPEPSTAIAGIQAETPQQESRRAEPTVPYGPRKVEEMRSCGGAEQPLRGGPMVFRGM